MLDYKEIIRHYFLHWIFDHKSTRTDLELLSEWGKLFENTEIDKIKAIHYCAKNAPLKSTDFSSN